MNVQLTLMGVELLKTDHNGLRSRAHLLLWLWRVSRIDPVFSEWEPPCCGPVTSGQSWRDTHGGWQEWASSELASQPMDSWSCS